MSRYIDADKLQKDGWKLRREKHGLLTSTYETMELDCAPTADVRKNVRGEWLHISDGYCDVLKCSQCGKTTDSQSNFCPNCGADMRGDKT